MALIPPRNTSGHYAWYLINHPAQTAFTDTGYLHCEHGVLNIYPVNISLSNLILQRLQC